MKPQESNIIENVSDTAFWVAYYRVKESERSDALFKDPLAAKLVGEKGKIISDQMAAISRYTEWSVVSRTVIIDRFIEDLVQAGVDAVINLGAGLDTRPYRMKLPATLKWVEADYKNIIQHKEALLSSDQPRCELTRVIVDLANAEERRKFLETAAPHAKKVLVITEGVIPYLSPEQVIELSNDLSTHARMKFWITEYFHPKVYPYLKHTVRGAKMKNAPFKFYPDDWYGFFSKLGWSPKQTKYSGEIAIEFKRMPPMPKWVKWILPLMSKKAKQEGIQRTGYIVFERKN